MVAHQSAVGVRGCSGHAGLVLAWEEHTESSVMGTDLPTSSYSTPRVVTDYLLQAPQTACEYKSLRRVHPTSLGESFPPGGETLTSQPFIRSIKYGREGRLGMSQGH